MRPMEEEEMTTMAWVWKSPAFGDFRVTVESVSVGGVATLVKFTRGERYRPAESGSDGTMWVLTSQIHKVNPRAEAVAKRTAETLEGKMPEATKRAPKKATGKAPVKSRGTTTPQFVSF